MCVVANGSSQRGRAAAMTESIEPLGLADFVYAYSEGVAHEQQGHREGRVKYGMRCLRKLRGDSWPYHGKAEFSERLSVAFNLRDARANRRAPDQLSLFDVSEEDDLGNWLRTQRSYLRAWHLCERGSWLLQIAASIEVDHKLVVRAACDCARAALPYVPEGEDRPRITIETTEAWCEGRATIEEVAVASRQAYGGGSCTYRSGDVAGGNAYYAAGSASGDAAHRSFGEGNAAAYVADAASVASADACRAAHKQCANLIRSRIPWPAVRAAIRTQEGGRLP